VLLPSQFPCGKKDPVQSGIFVAEKPLDLVGAYQTRRLYTFKTMKIPNARAFLGV
jgi:hypothetical protein